MARSTYVYVVKCRSGAIRGCFTVKYEAEDCMERNEKHDYYLELIRFRDGRYSEGVQIAEKRFPDTMLQSRSDQWKDEPI